MNLSNISRKKEALETYESTSKESILNLPAMRANDICEWALYLDQENEQLKKDNEELKAGLEKALEVLELCELYPNGYTNMKVKSAIELLMGILN